MKLRSCSRPFTCFDPFGGTMTALPATLKKTIEPFHEAHFAHFHTFISLPRLQWGRLTEPVVRKPLQDTQQAAYLALCLQPSHRCCRHCMDCVPTNTFLMELHR